MIEPFERYNDGHIVPVVNPKALWLFEEPSVATREYDGTLMRLTPGTKGYEGWQYYMPTMLDTLDVWHPVYPRQSFKQQLKATLNKTWSERVSGFEYVQEFEDAELIFTEDYDYGEYWLVPADAYSNWTLVPVDKAEQISNINELEIHKMDSVIDIYTALQNAMVPLRENIYGVIFTSNGRRARVRPSDFDWENYE